jgi:hypothetical protein
MAKSTKEKRQKMREETWPNDYPDNNRKVIIQDKPIENQEADPEKWGKDYLTDEDALKTIKLRFGTVTPLDKLKFAKRILLFLFFLFLITLSLTLLFPDNPQTAKIWPFTSQAINSLVFIMVGFYFVSNKQ